MREDRAQDVRWEPHGTVVNPRDIGGEMVHKLPVRVGSSRDVREDERTLEDRACKGSSHLKGSERSDGVTWTSVREQLFREGARVICSLAGRRARSRHSQELPSSFLSTRVGAEGRTKEP
jgi:hypothetical protein